MKNKLKRFGIVVFPGTNCDRDSYHVFKNVFKLEVNYIWFKDKTKWDEYDMIVLPGGFSYGDYLRPAAIARFSPALEGIEDYIKSGGLVLGICNGFQILLEMNILPGAMLINKKLKFVCKRSFLKVENRNTPYTRIFDRDHVIELPVAHSLGQYYIDKKGLEELITNNQIVLRYSDADGNVSKEANFNGSIKNIAGICNKKRNVLGLMPHPERASEEMFSTADGYLIFQSVLQYLNEKR